MKTVAERFAIHRAQLKPEDKALDKRIDVDENELTNRIYTLLRPIEDEENVPSAQLARVLHEIATTIEDTPRELYSQMTPEDALLDDGLRMGPVERMREEMFNELLDIPHRDLVEMYVDAASDEEVLAYFTNATSPENVPEILQDVGE